MQVMNSKLDSMHAYELDASSCIKIMYPVAYYYLLACPFLSDIWAMWKFWLRQRNEYFWNLKLRNEYF